jgi:hypothetical protein
MKYHTPLTILALLVSLLAGCSKHSAVTTSSNSKATDLGVIEVSDGIPIQQSLDGSRACVITPTVFRNGSVRLSIAIVETNSAGVVQTLATPRVQSSAGQPVEVSVGDIDIRLTTKIRQNQQPADDKQTILPGRHLSESQVAEIAGRELSGVQNYSCQFTDGVWQILEIQTGTWISSSTTNADGHIFVHSAHPEQLVLRVNDADGKIERIKTP